MADRISKKMIESLFVDFVKAIGGRLAKSYGDVGGYALDYNSVYGGYTIVQIVNSGGGQSQPFGYHRMKANEFYSCMQFTIRAIELKKKR